MAAQAASPELPGIDPESSGRVANPAFGLDVYAGSGAATRRQRVQRMSMAQRVRDVHGKATHRAAAIGSKSVRAFRVRPLQSSVVALAAISFFFTLISTWQAWYLFDLETVSVDSSSNSTTTLTHSGTMALTALQVCSKINEGKATSVYPGAMCTTVYLMDLPTRMITLSAASAGTLAVLILLSLTTGTGGLYLSWLLRVNDLRRLPNAIRCLNRPWAAPALHGSAAFSNMLAFAIYASAFDSVGFATVIGEVWLGAAAAGSSAHTTVKGAGYGPGFGLVVTAFLVSAAACGIAIGGKNEEDHDVDNVLPPSAARAPDASTFPPALPPGAHSGGLPSEEPRSPVPPASEPPRGSPKPPPPRPPPAPQRDSGPAAAHTGAAEAAPGPSPGNPFAIE